MAATGKTDLPICGDGTLLVSERQVRWLIAKCLQANETVVSRHFFDRDLLKALDYMRWCLVAHSMHHGPHAKREQGQQVAEVVRAVSLDDDNVIHHADRVADALNVVDPQILRLDCFGSGISFLVNSSRRRSSSWPFGIICFFLAGPPATCSGGRCSHFWSSPWTLLLRGHLILL